MEREIFILFFFLPLLICYSSTTDTGICHSEYKRSGNVISGVPAVEIQACVFHHCTTTTFLSTANGSCTVNGYFSIESSDIPFKVCAEGYYLDTLKCNPVENMTTSNVTMEIMKCENISASSVALENILPENWVADNRTIVVKVAVAQLVLASGVNKLGCDVPLENNTLIIQVTVTPKGCPLGTYGLDCSNTCSCENNGACHTLYGTCVCPDGFEGERCEEERKAPKTAKSTDMIMGPSIGGATFLFIALVVTILVFVWRRMNLNSRANLHGQICDTSHELHTDHIEEEDYESLTTVDRANTHPYKRVQRPLPSVPNQNGLNLTLSDDDLVLIKGDYLTTLPNHQKNESNLPGGASQPANMVPSCEDPPTGSGDDAKITNISSTNSYIPESEEPEDNSSAFSKQQRKSASVIYCNTAFLKHLDEDFTLGHVERRKGLLESPRPKWRDSKTSAVADINSYLSLCEVPVSPFENILLSTTENLQDVSPRTGGTRKRYSFNRNQRASKSANYIKRRFSFPPDCDFIQNDDGRNNAESLFYQNQCKPNDDFLKEDNGLHVYYNMIETGSGCRPDDEEYWYVGSGIPRLNREPTYSYINAGPNIMKTLDSEGEVEYSYAKSRLWPEKSPHLDGV